MEMDLVNASLMIMFEYKQNISPKYLYDNIGEKGFFDIDNIDFTRILETIVDIGFANKTMDHTATMGQLKDMFFYTINSKGINFIESIPNEFKERPYSFYLNRKEDKIQKKIEKEILNRQQTQSIIDTNQSVTDTNLIQQKNIKRNDKLFWVTLFVAIAGAIASWVSIINANENRSLKDKVQTQDTLIKSLQKQLLQTKNVVHHPITAKDSSVP